MARLYPHTYPSVAQPSILPVGEHVEVGGFNMRPGDGPPALGRGVVVGHAVLQRAGWRDGQLVYLVELARVERLAESGGVLSVVVVDPSQVASIGVPEVR